MNEFCMEMNIDNTLKIQIEDVLDYTSKNNAFVWI